MTFPQVLKMFSAQRSYALLEHNAVPRNKSHERTPMELAMPKTDRVYLCDRTRP